MPDRCRQCRRKLSESKLASDIDATGLCPRCSIEERTKRHVVANIGEPDPEALEFINSVWHLIPDDAEFRRYEKPPIRLKQLIREESEAIRKQAPFRASMIAAVERATGLRRPALVTADSARNT